ncbi:MAG: ribonuclease Z [Bacteroidales bacterium]|nr:ribonuclease Z [Bacteroidales bacterium]
MSLSVKILGCGSALPSVNRCATAQIVIHNTHPYLVDCAESTQVQMRKYGIRMAMINHIFISHLHGDHFYGIFGLLSSLGLLGRTNDLYIHCHEDLQFMLESKYSPVKIEELGFKIIFVPLKYDKVELIYDDKGIEIYSIPVEHRIPTCGFIFKEKPLLRNIKKEMIEKYQLTVSEIVAIKNGSDLYLENEIIPNQELTLDPPSPKSYAFITDTLPLKSVEEAIAGCDVLYHEATYENDLIKRAQETCHTTAGQAAEIAKNSGVKQLLIGHYSKRYKNTELLDKQAKEIFENSIAVEDGMEFNI